MAITENDVKHVAKLAKLSFKDDEIAHFTEQLGDIIQMVEQLNEIDTTGVPVMTHGYPVINVMREDIASLGTDRELLFENVPEKQAGFIKVPAMFEGGEEA